MAGSSGVITNRIRYFMKLERTAFFQIGACAECHKIPSDDVRMMVCSKCKLIWYCGKECQKNNWTYHKEFCKATSSVAEDLNGPGSFIFEIAKEAVEYGMEYAQYIVTIREKVCHKLNRKMDNLEIRTICSPKVCEVCKDAHFQILKACKICYNVFYCSEEHASQDSVRHNKFCPEYFLSLQCYHLVKTEGMPYPGSMPFEIPRVNIYKPMIGTLKDYIKPTFESNIDVLLSDWVSYPFSLLYALEFTGVTDGTKKIRDVEELTVLMFDAFNANYETMTECLTWEYMLHFLPKLKKLYIILYEPNSEIEDDYAFHDPILCTDCISNKCNITMVIVKDYRSYVRSNSYKKPSVIYNHVMYHQLMKKGMTEKYLPYPENEAPLVLIGSDKETMERVHVFAKVEKLDIILPLQLNPFRGWQPTKVPIIDFMGDGGYLQYAHCYIVGLRRQVKKEKKKISKRK